MAGKYFRSASTKARSRSSQTLVGGARWAASNWPYAPRVHTRDLDGLEPAAIAAVVDFAGKRALEVGCGDGRLTTFAAERAAYVYAFDPKRDEVEKAKRALRHEARARVSFAVHDAEALNVERRRFDLALCGWSL